MAAVQEVRAKEPVREAKAKILPARLELSGICQATTHRLWPGILLRVELRTFSPNRKRSSVR